VINYYLIKYLSTAHEIFAASFLGIGGFIAYGNVSLSSFHELAPARRTYCPRDWIDLSKEKLQC